VNTFLLALACLHAQIPDLSLKAPVPMVYTAAGANAAALQATVDEFREAVGPLNAPGVASANPRGRREINWDGVPDGDFAFDFFNKTSPRGMVLSSADRAIEGFRVGSGEQLGYARVKSFSGAKVFVTTGTNTYDCDFFVPGTERRGPVSAFGAVFANVALPFSTWIEFFGTDGGSLGRYYVRPNAGGLSFAGVVFENKIIAKVRVSPGTAILGELDEPSITGRNLVAMDDFIFGEPLGASEN
jgi:hypothetical protein